MGQQYREKDTLLPFLFLLSFLVFRQHSGRLIHMLMELLFIRTVSNNERVSSHRQRIRIFVIQWVLWVVNLALLPE